MTHAEWLALLNASVRWQECYPKIAEITRPVLAALPAGKQINTDRLVELLWPDTECRGPDLVVHSRLYRALDAISRHSLADCVSFEGGVSYGRPAQFKRWHAPDPNRAQGEPPANAPTEAASLLDLKYEGRASEKRIFAALAALTQRVSTLEGYHHAQQ